MANQTELLNVSDEMKLDDVRQELCELESDEELCFSSLDTFEELYSSSATDTISVVFILSCFCAGWKDYFGLCGRWTFCVRSAGVVIFSRK